MAKLNSGRRKAMPKSEFAGPDKSFPVNDKTHARLAIGGATRSYNAGNISKSTENSIKSQARAKLGSGGDRKSQDFHMGKAHDHIVKAIGRRLAAKDK